MGLPKNLSKTLTITVVFTILHSIFILGCTQKNMNHENQNTSVAETSAADPLSIHQKAIAIDMHVDTAQRLLDARGIPVRVVSLPSSTVFDRQERSYREAVLARGLPDF